ncbi:MAG: hypothetical protein HZC54_15445 [Verrucomicrobia bacterium]|nr:hypothetical protein [Verrucomicrobiota bacterium]
MKMFLTVLMLAILAATGCRSSPKTSADNRDDLLGWYQLPNRHYRTREILPGPGTLIPVFKRGGVYCSVCRGVEVPLKPCPEGLEWGPAESSMRGTTIGVDTSSKMPYIAIRDLNAQYEADISTFGEKQFMSKIKKPSGLLDPTTTPPRTADDFLGCYQPVWFPVFRWIISRDGGQYHLEGQIADKDGWKTKKHEAATLEPLPDKLGFVWGRKKENRLVFNGASKRFECVLGPDDKLNLKMPLARINPVLPPGTGATSPPMSIGIPSWH